MRSCGDRHQSCTKAVPPAAAVEATALVAVAAHTPAATPRVGAAEPKRCVSKVIDRMPEPPKGSAAKAAVTVTEPEADATRMPAATLCVRTVGPKRCVNEAIERVPSCCYEAAPPRRRSR